VDKTLFMADAIDSGCRFSVAAREITANGKLPLIRHPHLRNTYLQTVEPPRTHDPISIRDLLKGGIVPQETQRGGGRVVADARM